MKSKLGLIIILFVFFSTGCGVKYDTGLNMKDLPGSLVLRPYKKDFQKDYNGILIFTPSINKYEVKFDTSSVANPEFNQDKSKIIMRNENSYFEYNMKNQSLILELLDNISSNYSCVKFIPNSKAVSFIKFEETEGLYSGNIYVLDTNSKSKKMLIKDVYKDYSWNKSGKSLLYANRVKQDDNSFKYSIFEYNVEEHTPKFLFEGFQPEYSKDNAYIAYEKANGELIIREVSTGNEWKYTTGSIDSYRFSPDDKYIAILQASTQYGSKNFQMIIWDFKHSKKYVLIDNIISGHTGFDWK